MMDASLIWVDVLYCGIYWNNLQKCWLSCSQMHKNFLILSLANVDLFCPNPIAA
jgi:hypothetical protein